MRQTDGSRIDIGFSLVTIRACGGTQKGLPFERIIIRFNIPSRRLNFFSLFGHYNSRTRRFHDRPVHSRENWSRNTRGNLIKFASVRGLLIVTNTRWTVMGSLCPLWLLLLLLFCFRNDRIRVLTFSIGPRLSIVSTINRLMQERKKNAI